MAWGGLAESWIPHNFGFLLKAEIWQLLLEKWKGVQEICGGGWDVVRSIWEAGAQSEPPWESTPILSPSKPCPHPLPGTKITWCGVLTVWWNLIWDAQLVLKGSSDT